jgi:gliding motility-associated protein GldM
MAGLNETPRQKMIGILYLVLLGLAATTITDRVLDAFFTISTSLETTSKDIAATTESRIKAFESTNMKTDAVKNTPFYDRAKKVKAICDSLENFLEEVRSEMVHKAGGYKDSVNFREVKNRDDAEVSLEVMGADADENKEIAKHSKGLELRKMILEKKQEILNVMTPEERAGVTVSIDAPTPKPIEGTTGKVTWEYMTFGEGVPATAALCALSKIEMDIKNTENSVVRKILSSATQTDFVFDDYKIVVVPESKYVLVGQKYKAEVFLSAFSETLNPEIIVAGQKLKVEKGTGTYEAAATSDGPKKFDVQINMKKANGDIRPFKTDKPLEYMVAKPSVNISADKMKVFYIGVPNPVTISAASVGNESLRPTISGTGNGVITGDKGAYSVMVKNRGTVTISVSGELEKGKVTPLGSSDFRCKTIPMPNITFGGKTTGSLPTAAIKGISKIFAVNSPDFDFDAKFNIKSFKLFINNPREDLQTYKGNGANFGTDIQAALAKIKPGAKIILDEIVVVGPDGGSNVLDSKVFSAN